MQGEVEGVEALLIQVCADCNKPVPQAGGHIHKGFSPTRQVEVVRVSDLDAIRSQERQRVKEEASEPVHALASTIGRARVLARRCSSPSLEKELADAADAMGLLRATLGSLEDNGG